MISVCAEHLQRATSYLSQKRPFHLEVSEEGDGQLQDRTNTHTKQKRKKKSKNKLFFMINYCQLVFFSQTSSERGQRSDDSPCCNVVYTEQISLNGQMLEESLDLTEPIADRQTFFFVATNPKLSIGCFGCTHTFKTTSFPSPQTNIINSFFFFWHMGKSTRRKKKRSIIFVLFVFTCSMSLKKCR